MKKLNLLLFLWCFCLLGMVAEPIDQTKALTAAQSFLKNKRTASGARRYAPGQLPQITLAGQVNGLYVYNVNNGGFVIVSNDDATIPVLGFGDSGNIDINHMPDNMKAWLQGYADEIAWYQKHGVKAASSSRSVKVGSHSIDPIDPLVTTEWNQDAPFNDLCPTYDGSNRSATGCAATAMAQVMNYHKWPQSETEPIKGYTTTSWEIDLSEGLPATTFDWANMKDNYKHGYTSEEGDAVAKLMQYCGYAMEMDYGQSSGAYTNMMLSALTEYFDYNSETTQYVSRNNYNASKWADLIYHELANGRPVLYCGLASVGGHAFVCDGYKFQNETDFFHINWGWGGTSDEYYVLSALNPYQQGIGGSSSNDGFNVGQEIIIGIQPSTGTGTIADITPNVINLTVNSMMPETNNVYVDNPVNIILNVTNNSADDYDGTIFLGRQYKNEGITNYGLLVGGNVQIAAGETKDVTITLTPNEVGTYYLVAYLPAGYGYDTDKRVLATLTVEMPNVDGFVPIYSNFENELSRSQFIIPATNLQGMQYANLNAITFSFINTMATVFSPLTWGSAEYEVYLGEVEETTFADATLKDWTSLEKVYCGQMSAFQGEMKITFDTPYQYMGGNLLVGVKQTVIGDFHENFWLGEDVPGASLGGSSNEEVPVTQRDFLPTTSFDFTPGTAPAVVKPLALSANYTGGTTAEVKWTSTESAWDIEVNGTVTENVTNPYTLTDLEPAAVYTIRVRAKNDSGESDWSTPYTFNTELADDWCQVRLDLLTYMGGGWCGAAIRVVDKLTGVVLGTVSNTNRVDFGETQSYTMDVPVGRDIDFVWKEGFWDEESLYEFYDMNGDLIFSGRGTMSNAVTWHVDCGTSSWHMPSNLTAEKIGPHSAELSWTENGEATAWVVAYKTADATDFTEVCTDTKTFTLTGLDPETKYAVRVRPATDEATKWSAETVFTTDIPNPVPTQLAITPAATTADLTWEGFAENYDVRYGIAPENSTWLQYDNDTYLKSWGSDKSTSLTWGVMYPNSMVEGKTLKKVSWFEVSQYYDSDITVKVYSGVNAPGKLLSTQNVTPKLNGAFHEVTLPKPVSVTKGENLWIMLTAKGTKVISYCKCDEPNSQWIYRNEKYEHLADWKSEYAGYGFMIRGYVETSALDESAIDWTTTTSSETSCQLTGLMPETDYVVQVRGDYGDEGIGQWATTTCTTHSLSDAPNALVTSDITANTADVTWAGYQDNYDLRYKVNLIPDLTADFDDSTLGDWTNIDADGDGYNWVIFTKDNQYQSPYLPIGYDYIEVPGRGHNGSVDKVISASYSNNIMEALTPDNYLVSPLVKLGGTISFWAFSESPADFREHFGVAVSTTGNTDAADFTTIEEWTLSAGRVWKQYIVDLSAYEGQTGYVAIRHFGCYNQLIMAIDDIVIEMPDDDTPWTTIENISANSQKLTGLDPQTEYKVQVRGNNTPDGNATPWSRTASFTTLNGGTTAITPTDLRESQNSMLKSGWFSLDGRRLNSKPTQKGIYIHNGKKVVL